ncbi:MAG: hypothetical protein K0R54_103 [Clostridiaceae bacterium]|jgi:hypothetical protein|nr:hypothetical protein [Clostridiaceae bacterium]
MNLFDVFNRKKVLDTLEIKTTLAKLQFLASTMENNTDKENDIVHWKEQIDLLNNAELNNDYLSYLKQSYNTLYKLYIRKHHPDILNNISY